MTDLPKTQRAYLLPAPDPNLASIQLLSDHPVTAPSALRPGQCLVKIQYSGVCHSDLSIAKGDWPVKPKASLVGGHEGIGHVVAIAEGTYGSSIKVGELVGVKWVGDSCAECELCRKGLEQHCPKLASTGFQVDGTFCEYAVASVKHVIRIPDSLPPAAATAIMCAGVTVYKALKSSNFNVGDWIVIPGAGGGLGHLAVQYAVARGLRVIAIDSGPGKKESAIGNGAEHFIDFAASANLIADVRALTTDGLGAHGALLAVGSAKAYEAALMYLRPTATVLACGIPPGKFEALFVLFVPRGITIKGTFVGNRQDTIEAVNIAASGKVKVKYEMKKLSELNEVYHDMIDGKIVGRVVLDISQ